MLNSKIEDDSISTTVCGTNISLNKDIFAGLFVLPTEGLSALTDVPEEDVNAMLNVLGKDPL
ncbi:hypothetical protein, partial [Serratia marcescens]|uniref:hypothetical protein n=1 Tax=Serratia marcescens TaxID=615 RepID=UPI0028148698